MKRNLLLFLALVSSSSLISIFLGEKISTSLFPFAGSWIVPFEIIHFVNSFPFVYYFLAPFLFLSWGEGKKWVWIIVSVLPLVIIEIYIGAFVEFLSLNLTFFISGVFLSFITKFTVGKIKK